MTRYYGIAMGIAYFLFLGLLGQYVIGPAFGKHLSGVGFSVIGMLIMLSCVPLLMFTKLGVPWIFLALLGLMFDNAGIAMQWSGASTLNSWFSAMMAQVIFATIVTLVTVKEYSSTQRARTRRLEHVE